MRRARPVDPVLLRERMVLREVVGRGVTDLRVVEALRRVPRHLFVDEALAARAYDGSALPIGHGQTISQPSTVALMTELLGVEPGHRVLEVGTGSGYQAAVLACLAGEVDTVERLAPLARRARRALESLRLSNVRVWQSDGTLGLPERAPFPRIMVTAGSPEPPPALLEQLAEGGRLVLPVADADGASSLVVVERHRGAFRVERTVRVAFVPLIGAQGYRPSEAP